MSIPLNQGNMVSIPYHASGEQVELVGCALIWPDLVAMKPEKLDHVTACCDKCLIRLH